MKRDIYVRDKKTHFKDIFVTPNKTRNLLRVRKFAIFILSHISNIVTAVESDLRQMHFIYELHVN